MPETNAVQIQEAINEGTERAVRRENDRQNGAAIQSHLDFHLFIIFSDFRLVILFGI